jgi:transposase-like protein
MSKSYLNSPHLHDEAAAFKFVEDRVWPNGPRCPKCGEQERAGKLKGKSTRMGVYKCYACRKPFTVRVGTIFEDSHIEMRLWLQAIFLIASPKKGISSNQLARVLGITVKSAWHLSHRIRLAMDQQFGKLGKDAVSSKSMRPTSARSRGRAKVAAGSVIRMRSWRSYNATGASSLCASRTSTTFVGPSQSTSIRPLDS